VKKQRDLLIIILAGFLVYLNSLGNNFVWDDILLIVNNDAIKGLRLLEQVLSKPLFYFSESAARYYYRPLQTLSYVLDYSLFGLEPWGFHLVNVLMHAAVAVLVYVLLERLFNQSHLSFWAALLFAVHPLHTSVVGYISGRADILVAFFSLGSLCLFLKNSSPASFVSSLVFFLLALFSKEAALIFPVVLIIVSEIYISAAREEGFFVRTLRLRYGVFFLMPLAYILLRKGFNLGVSIPALHETDFSTMFFTLPRAALLYLKLAYLPSGLHIFRSANYAGASLAAMLSVAGCALVAGALLYYGWRRDKVIFFAVAIFAAWLIPAASGMFINPDYYVQGKAAIAESWFYLPCIGIVTLTARLFTGYGRHPGRVLQKTILVLFVMYLSVITITANRHWKNNRILFSYTLRYAGTSPVLYRNLAWVYLNKGDTVSAIQMYSHALGLRQTDKSRAILYKDLGLAYMLNKDDQKAVQVVREAIKIDPDNAGSHGLLGMLYSYGKTGNAREECAKALEIDPFEPTAFNYFLQASTFNKEISAYLIEKYKEALKGPHGFGAYKIYRSLGIAYLYAQAESEAIVNLKRAEQINPYDPKTNTALAICYVKKGDAVLAERFFKKSLRLNPFDKEAYSNLALFYSELGRNKEALFMRQKVYSVNLFD
jgi:Flp pilus assembly protein TadD